MFQMTFFICLMGFSNNSAGCLFLWAGLDLASELHRASSWTVFPNRRSYLAQAPVR